MAGPLTSFANEHTVEYAVVSAAKNSFSQINVTCAPIFYWKTREGARLSNRLHAGVRARLVALFPRRPKLAENNKSLSWKINFELFEFAKEASQHQVPTFAAMPCARTLMELASTSDIFWKRLDDEPEEELVRSVRGKPTNSLSTTDFRTEALATAPLMPWQSIESAMDELRSAVGTGGGHWFGFGGYKPVYLMFDY